MGAPAGPDATTLLTRVLQADGAAGEELLALVYDDLKALARRMFRAQPADHTLQPTALVHEAYLRLIDQTTVDWQGRAHFFGVAAKAMRHVLVDHARARGAAKRGGGWKKSAEAPATIAFTEPSGTSREVDLLALDAALTRLAEMDEREARIVELRFFGDLGVDEVAQVLGISKSTVVRSWRHARAWLSRALQEEGA